MVIIKQLHRVKEYIREEIEFEQDQKSDDTNYFFASLPVLCTACSETKQLCSVLEIKVNGPHL